MPQPPSDAPPALAATLQRIADALERLAPQRRAEPDFAAARIFRFDAARSLFHPAHPAGVPLELLSGFEGQKARFVENLQRFAHAAAANHVLLWGARGTGKSSLVRAGFEQVAAEVDALRLVEVEREALHALPDLFSILRARAERFLVFCDDLSFEEGAAAAKSMKSALEGGVAGPPHNVLFVATSNRRHLMPRSHEDADRLAAAEDAEETVSASDRFGLWIGFPPMDQPTYLKAVHAYADALGLDAADLEARALRWSQARGARSGRVAVQFVRDLAGELGKDLPF